MEALIFDTTFLIDLQRERNAGLKGVAHAFLHENAEACAFLPAVAYGEFAEGFANLTSTAFLSLVESFEFLPVTREIAGIYADITRTLRRTGRIIGTNDLWIAATAVREDRPLVTRNLDHFARVPGIQLRSY
ncbi:MAG: type II toxin-antitoxin system VapC family toxin [Verrucomicrobiales bacterium]